MFTLTDKIALVTGASRGIGRATARALARADARVLVHYGRAAAEAESLAAEICAAGGQAETVQADLALADGPHRLAQWVRDTTGGRLDILVANAGISFAASMEDHTVEKFDELFATNVRAPFFLVQQLLPLFGNGGSIVVVSSLAAHAVPGSPGQAGAPSLPAYAATKGALDTLVKHWASLLGPRGVRVNAVAPRRDRHRHVELHQDRRWPGADARDAGAQTHRSSGRRGGRHRFSGVGCGSLDHRRDPAGRWRLQALKTGMNASEQAAANKVLALEAFDTLFNRRDYVAAARFWSPEYLQHSAHIAPGREGLFALVKSLPATLRYEPGSVVAEGDLVILHGRFSGFGQPVNWIVADILRIVRGVLVEHWDVIQDEATREQSRSGLPMFSRTFPNS